MPEKKSLSHYINKAQENLKEHDKKIRIELNFEENNLSEAQKNKLKNVGENCPVAKSLHPDINQIINFNF